jgi:nitroimidazol reductase NimA-like FMN-containing flavoprotein (pyridoxamine 5'-phosphate oxidase superfamily)
MSTHPKEPKVSRPFINDNYGIPKTLKGTLPWSYVVERLENAQNYWVATINPNNTPHVMPVWGAYVEGNLYIEGSPRTRNYRNLEANPSVVIHLEPGYEAVILEGEAHQIIGIERPVAEKLAAVVSAKYSSRGYTPKPDNWDKGGLYKITIRKAFAWTKFPDDTTRWIF